MLLHLRQRDGAERNTTHLVLVENSEDERRELGRVSLGEELAIYLDESLRRGFTRGDRMRTGGGGRAVTNACSKKKKKTTTTINMTG
jgi:hypothetical protein